MRRAVRERLSRRRQRRRGVRLHGGALRRLRAAEAAVQVGHAAAVAGRPAGPAGRRRRPAARRPQAPRPGAAGAADGGGARQGRLIAGARATPMARSSSNRAKTRDRSRAPPAPDARIPPRPPDHRDGRRAARPAAEAARSPRPTGSTTTPPSIATSSPRSSASARRARCPSPTPPPPAPRSSAACSPPPSTILRWGRATPMARHGTASSRPPLPRHPPLRPRPLSPDRPARPPRRALHRPPRPAAIADAPAAPTLAETIAAARARLAAAPDDPDALSALGEALTYEADGVVTPPAQDAFRRALERTRTIRARCSISACTRRRAATRRPRSSAGGR